MCGCMLDKQMSAASADTGAAAAPSKNRLNRLLQIEQSVQKEWDAAKIFEQDALTAVDRDVNSKYFATFPYPYIPPTRHHHHASSYTLCVCVCVCVCVYVRVRDVCVCLSQVHERHSSLGSCIHVPES